MSLFRKMFRDKGTPAAPVSGRSSEPPESEDTTEEATHSRSAPRREVVHVVLRETMRRHGIPHDWIECRAMSMVQPNRSTGTYVTFVVTGGQDQLLSFVPSFQASFRDALHRFDPRASDWMRGLSWEFADGSLADRAAASAPAALEAPAFTPPPAPAAPQVTAPPVAEQDDLEKDLAALFAIRDAALQPKAGGEGR